MDRLRYCYVAVLTVFWPLCGTAWSDDVAGDAAHTIFGIVMELRSGTADVPVCLCDAATGLPVAKETYGPLEWGRTGGDRVADQMAIVVTNDKGEFRFENVPDGKYRVVAQKWIGPFKGIFEEHGTVIQLMGSADEVVVPRPAEYYEALVALTPPGRGIVQFDQDVGNSSTVFFLSTSPPAFDPILGPHAMGTPFLQQLIGVNRMPLGKTTVIGVPVDRPLYAFLIAPDNSPGFATIEVPASQAAFFQVPREPFVAGWSDGRKTPPPRLATLMDFMEKHSLTAEGLLEIPELSNANFEKYEARMLELQNDLSREVDLGDGTTARVGDILAAQAYQALEE